MVFWFVHLGDYSCEYGSTKFYAFCGFGGILSCGITHTAVVPLDLVKCRIQENSYLWRTSLYLAASASAEFFADIALAPMEAAKVRIQTQPGYANTLRQAAPKMYAEEGIWAFYKGVAPLWMRQIPYTMMKFACFERTVEALYKYVVPKPRSECSKAEQLVVTFVAGYIGKSTRFAICYYFTTPA
ncbi:hypothetical protein AB205_0151160 [Aquarana catesbeiana]|uniref:Solute carrier family 25 member 3 n=1 Tax=Aquarana catesbeiana TaxID=8400 RepID=A0A2G9RW36_AQUCT|nr:hypothetical protein AB205_0151160 [Aquarana catesbeiana]